jgi:hypothetical protein
VNTHTIVGLLCGFVIAVYVTRRIYQAHQRTQAKIARLQSDLNARKADNLRLCTLNTDLKRELDTTKHLYIVQLPSHKVGDRLICHN